MATDKPLRSDERSWAKARAPHNQSKRRVRVAVLEGKASLTLAEDDSRRLNESSILLDHYSDSREALLRFSKVPPAVVLLDTCLPDA